MTRVIYGELFPDQPWPGDEAAVAQMAAEIRGLRLLTDTIVTTALDEMQRCRSVEEIQRAHDIVGQFCVETSDADTFKYVSALCWVLRHEHNEGFPRIMAKVEARLAQLGIELIRLPKLHVPGKESV